MKDKYLRTKSIKLTPETFAYFEDLVKKENKSFSIIVEELLKEHKEKSAD